MSFSDPQKIKLWTEAHNILRGTPTYFSLFRYGTISEKEFLDSYTSYKNNFDKILKEAKEIGGCFEHYLNLAHCSFMTDYICLTQNKMSIAECFNKFYTKEKEDISFYHMQWALLDLVDAEVNRPDIPASPPYPGDVIDPKRGFNYDE